MSGPGGRGHFAVLDADQLAARVAATGSLTRSCAELGVCHRTVLRRMRSFPAFAEKIADARRAYTPPLFRHGLPGSYRACRCAKCRFANTVRADKRRDKAAKNLRLVCPVCGRPVGLRDGRRVAHHGAPARVCPGSELSTHLRVPA